MRMTKPAPPPEFMSALRAGLAQFLDPGDPTAASLLGQYETHEVYSLGLDQFPKAKEKDKPTDLLPKASSIGWRFMAAGSAYNLGCHVGGTGPKIMGISRTAETQVMLQSVRQIEECIRKPDGDWKNMKGSDYELRAVRIPGLLIELLWLHCPADRTHDRVVPFAGFVGSAADPETKKPEMMKPYPAGEFFMHVWAAADRRRNAHKKWYPQDFPNDGRAQ